MEVTLTESSFIECWKKFSNENEQILLQNYSNSDFWKNNTEGNGLALFTIFFKRHFEYKFQTKSAIGFPDLLVYRPEFVADIQKISKSNQYETLSIDCPIGYDLIFKFEPDISVTPENLIKLTHHKAPLKILVTQFWEQNHEKQDWFYIHETLVENFGKVLQQVDRFQKDELFTAYLLIVGQKVGNRLEWKYNLFTTPFNGGISRIEDETHIPVQSSKLSSDEKEDFLTRLNKSLASKEVELFQYLSELFNAGKNSALQSNSINLEVSFVFLSGQFSIEYNEHWIEYNDLLKLFDQRGTNYSYLYNWLLKSLDNEDKIFDLTDVLIHTSLNSNFLYDMSNEGLTVFNPYG